MDALDRLHRRLLEAVRRNRMETEDHSLTIADIYQHLVPYRLVRGELGFSELKEYEHALLRLLAGERDYLQTEMPQVAEEFQRELRSPNPILGIYRDYAAVGVSLTAAGGDAAGTAAGTAAPSAAAAPAPAPVAPAELAKPVPPPAAPMADDAPAADGSPAQLEPQRGAATPERISDGVELPAAAEQAAACWRCEEALPLERTVRFCPYCGTSQLRCTSCGTMLEPQWRFCIQCGVAQGQQAGS